jgi:hypothetical protein
MKDEMIYKYKRSEIKLIAIPAIKVGCEGCYFDKFKDCFNKRNK